MSAPFDPKKPCKTRDGRTVEAVRSGFKFPNGESIVAEIGGESRSFFADGRYTDAGDHPLDLINILEERTEFRAAYIKHGMWRLGASPKRAVSGARLVQQRALRCAPGATAAGIYKLTFLGGDLTSTERVE